MQLWADRRGFWLSVAMVNMLNEFPLGKISSSTDGGSMNLELHIMRGETVTCLESHEAGLIVAKFQMGTSKEALIEKLSPVAHPDILRRIVDLYTNPANLDRLEQLDAKQRHLVIRDYA